MMRIIFLLILVSCASSPPPEREGPQCRTGLKLQCEYYAGGEKCVCITDREFEEFRDSLESEDDWQ